MKIHIRNEFHQFFRTPQQTIDVDNKQVLTV